MDYKEFIYIREKIKNYKKNNDIYDIVRNHMDIKNSYKITAFLLRLDQRINIIIYFAKQGVIFSHQAFIDNLIFIKDLYIFEYFIYIFQNIEPECIKHGCRLLSSKVIDHIKYISFDNVIFYICQGINNDNHRQVLAYVEKIKRNYNIYLENIFLHIHMLQFQINIYVKILEATNFFANIRPDLYYDICIENENYIGCCYGLKYGLKIPEDRDYTYTLFLLSNNLSDVIDSTNNEIINILKTQPQQYLDTLFLF